MEKYYVTEMRKAVLVILIMNIGLIECSFKEIPALISFGDSTLDVGNNNDLFSLAKSNHVPYGRDFPGQKITGRFCNGLLVTDYIASMLGLMSPTLGYLNPEAYGERIVTGVTFASSASGINDDTGKTFNILNLKDQLNLYKQYREDLRRVVGAANASRILSKAIYIISTGNNDYLQYFNLNILSENESNRKELRTHLLSTLSMFIKELQSLGAKKIAVLSLPALGCLPFERTLHGGGKGICVEYMNKEASIFNMNLKKLLTKMNETDGTRIAYLDSYGLLLSAATHPAQYGFVEGRRGCCGTGFIEASIFCTEFSVGTCLNASKYVFWDSFHPSDRMNSILAQSLLTQAVQQGLA
ncbi:hypothetical protein SUGI_1021490 [Cryptomeria japonica]|uniref:GDSL esterase/lipase At5g03810 n=1 Tax=Cryptomeria japonica TaxID=3369 RepID=UPI002414B5C3|nr:GDSL esterase/lipase At5g03810 [Cryptomeria japonica]GLJ48387.1 hypothetical protein SUGI_1021490 [Cryptomeria japonica]